MRLAGGALILALSLAAACRGQPVASPSPAPPVDGPIRLSVTAVPLNPNDPAQTTIGHFRYAGGIVVTSSDTPRLHGQSDLKIGSDGALHSQGDEGDVFDARLQLDAQGRLTGLTDGDISRLHGPDGAELTGKPHTDAEGLAILPNGDRLVSFEHDNHILRYPADGSPPVEAPFPTGVTFPANEGLEALTAFPAAGPDAYLAGAEGGQVWLCRVSAACTELPPIVPPAANFGLTALAVLPTPPPCPVCLPAIGGNAPVVAFLNRAFDSVQGNRIVITLVRFNGIFDEHMTTEVVDRFTLESPLTRDNFEGLAAVALPGPQPMIPVTRLYLLSDDNFNPSQRTLLMAFDWAPGPPTRPAPGPHP